MRIEKNDFCKNEESVEFLFFWFCICLICPISSMVFVLSTTFIIRATAQPPSNSDLSHPTGIAISTAAKPQVMEQWLFDHSSAIYILNEPRREQWFSLCVGHRMTYIYPKHRRSYRLGQSFAVASVADPDLSGTFTLLTTEMSCIYPHHGPTKL